MNTDFVADFKAFVQQQRLFAPTESTLLAVSGGIDSVVLCELFHRAGFRFGIAHLNFQLRSSESDGDEAFVAQLAQHYQVPFFIQQINIAQHAQDTGTSIQNAARQWRYEVLENFRREHQFNYLATAHHQNDVLETMLYNLSCGTGIAGLHGILPRRGCLVRPLLFADKEQITQFAHNNALQWREDSSNATDKYSRNKIRHEVVPPLQALNPRLAATFYENALRFADVESIYRQGLARYRKMLCIQQRNETLIAINKLRMVEPKQTVLYELLKDYGFQPPLVAQILAGLDGEAGKVFLSPSHQLLRDRKFLILSKREERDTSYTLIQQQTNGVEKEDYALSFASFLQNAAPTRTQNPEEAFLDADKLVFPLVLRRFQTGDYFYPLGMKMKKKKLSRFFGDLKLSRNEKERAWILEDNRQRIVWVVGYRIDERFKVTPNTQNLYHIHLAKK